MRKIPGAKTLNENLPPQAIIQDVETFVDSMQQTVGLNQTKAASARKLQRGPVAIFFTILGFLFYVLVAILGNHHGR